MTATFKIFNLKPWFIIQILLISFSATSQNLNSEVKAVVNVNDTKADVLELTATATNITEANHSIRYEFSVITAAAGKNNTSKNKQEGRFALAPFETKNLSNISVGIDPENRTIILLTLYDVDDKVIGIDRKVYDVAKQEKAEKQMSYQRKNEGIELIGMVTENTKTKPGRDFYDFFYQKYSLSPNQGNKIIEIDEMISFGRTTRVVVKVEDRIVFQFFARPKLDYLKEKADEALRQVTRYFEYLKNRNESITKY